MSATPGLRLANGILRRAQRPPVGVGRVGFGFDLLLVATPDVDGPQARAGIPTRIAEEHDDTAVGAEGRAFSMEAINEDALARPVRLHRTDLEIAARLPGVGDEIALGRPDRC